MSRIYERILGQDLNLGTGTATVQNPGGGTLNGHQISLSTFGIDGAAGSATAVVWDPPLLPAFQTTSNTVTVPGAGLGDLVAVTFSLSLQGMVLSGYVSAANTVVVLLTNATALPVDLASGTLKVLVARLR